MSAKQYPHKKYPLHGSNLTPHAAKILTYLLLPISLTQIGERLNIDYRNLKRAKSGLVNQGYITKDRAITSAGKTALKSALVGWDGLPPLRDNDKNRAAIVNQIIRKKIIRVYCEIKFKILKDHSNKATPELGGSFAVFRTWEIKNVQFSETTIDSVRVRRTPTNVIFIPPDIYDMDIMSAKDAALNFCYTIMGKVEAWFNITLGAINKINLTFSKQHISIVNTQLAKWYIEKKQKLSIVDLEDGRERIIIDHSKGLAELEAIHPHHAEDDAERLKAMLEDYTLRGIETPAQMKALILGLTERLGGLEQREKERKLNIPTLPNWMRGQL